MEKRQNILIIDDSEDNFAAIKEILLKQGYNPSYANCGQGGIEAVKKNIPDCILLDQNMPVMNGIEVCKKLKSDSSVNHIPIILWTGTDRKQDIMDGINAGADDFVTKVKDYDILLVRIKAMLRIKELYDKIQELSVIDELTKLLNRRAFNHRLHGECTRAARYKRPLSLLFIDIDDFKMYNDTYGHNEGDVVLVRLAEILRTNIRENDYAFRLGGEEFTVILPETNSGNAVVVAEKIRNQFEAVSFYPGLNNNEGIHKSISVGVTEYFPGIPQEDFVMNADQAMYRAKNAGKNRTSF